MAGQPAEGLRLRVQPPEPGGHHQGDLRERDARGDRPPQHPGDPDQRAVEHRPGGQGDGPEGAGRVRRRRAHRGGAARLGQPAAGGAARLHRRERGPAGRRHGAERGQDLRQPRGAAGPRQGVADRPAGRGLPDQGDGRRDRPGRALQRGLRLLQGRPGDQPRADLPGDDGEGSGLREQGDHRPERDAARGGDRRRRAAGAAALGVRRPRPRPRREPPDEAGPPHRPDRRRRDRRDRPLRLDLHRRPDAAGARPAVRPRPRRPQRHRRGEARPLLQDARSSRTWCIFDKRVLDLDLPVQTVLTADRQNLEVDAFARYRILDPLRFYQAVGNVGLANQRLASFTNSQPAQRARPLDPRRHRQDRARPADAPDPGGREPAGQGARHRDRRSAHDPRRPARAELAPPSTGG